MYHDLVAEPCRLTEPGVAEALQMRFYAGHPLQDENGYNIGALCIIDREPRRLTVLEQQRLQDLAQVVMQLFKLRLALHQRPDQAGAAWVKLYDHLDASLSRLDTLAELARWEESSTTPAALSYQQSREEEVRLVTHLLRQQVLAVLATLT